MKPERKLLITTKKLFRFFFVCIAGSFIAFYGKEAIAQTGASIPSMAPHDTTIKVPLNNMIDDGKHALKNLTSKSQATGATAAEKKIARQISDKLSSVLARSEAPALSFNLSLENALQYRPAPYYPNQASQQKFMDVVGLNGTILMFGVPLNINVSSSQQRGGQVSGFNNNLFKFDFDPKQMVGSMQSEWQRYDDLQKNVFAGAGFTQYSQKLINEQLKNSQQSLSNAFANPVISQFINNPAQLNQLMGMSEADIKKTLYNKLAQSADARQAMLAQAGRLSLIKANDQLHILEALARQPDINNYLRDPAVLQQLSTLSESQIKEQLASKLKPKTDNPANPDKKYGIEPITGLDFNKIINHALELKRRTDDAVLSDLSHQLAGRKITAAEAGNLLNGQVSSYSEQLAARLEQYNGKGALTTSALKATTDISKDQALNEEVNKVATTISQIQKQLGSQGYDVKRLLQIQSLVDKGFNANTLSETQRSLFSKDPATAAQSLMSKFSALKIGSFGIRAPGNTQNQDIFMNGAHATVRLGFTPVTIGYGSQNDVQSSKDANFNSTVYSAPRNLSYISTELKRGFGGGLKVSVIGSVNKQYNYNGYLMPAISSNNVALTLSKNYHMGKLGDAVVDVSKSTTVYANKYEVGNEAILDKKAGLNNYGTDLFESLSFSVNHHLDITQLGMSDNVYFSYAGMGYQNPGNNGYGGAQMKLGGSVKKSFYKNKLIINLRSDLRNQPISYTSNDQWHNLQMQLDGRYMINKKINVALKYINNATDKKVDNVVQPVYSFQKIQFDGNATYKIGHNYSVSHFIIGGQQLTNSYIANSTSNILLLNYTQTVLIKQRAITFNAFYNKELSVSKLIGNMFNADLSYQLPVTKDISVSTGATYLDNAGIARQVGIRETVRFASVKSFDIGSFIDLRKNLITPEYPDLYAAARAELTIKYHLKY